MAGAFETAARAAIEELIETHAQTSKFGFILTRDGMRGLTDALYDLLATSRSLKAAGDRFLQGGGPGATSAKGPARSRPR